METLTIIGLVGNIVQFVDFSSKLISKSMKVYRSSEGALAKNIDTETATNHLVLLNNKLKNAASTTNDSALERLCRSCATAADDLLAALDNVKVKGRQDKWKSMRKALRSVCSKEEIVELERPLAREQVLKQSYQLRGLDSTTKGLLHAIIQQKDVFKAAHDAQIALTETIHGETVSNIQHEHAITRRETIREIRQPKKDIIFAEQQQHLAKLPYAAQAAFNSFNKQQDPLCLQNTRVDVLNQIRAWADGGDRRCIFWLNGMAGTGKSTIARIIARKYYNQKRLGASFMTK